MATLVSSPSVEFNWHSYNNQKQIDEPHVKHFSTDLRTSGMEPNDDSIESSSISEDSNNSSLGTVDLLEEYWFFANLLHRKARMSRWFSDPCPSSGFSQEMLVKNQNADATSTTSKDNVSDQEDLSSSPSLQSSVEKGGRADEETDSRNEPMSQNAVWNSIESSAKSTSPGMTGGSPEEESSDKGRKPKKKPTRGVLLRTPSLPPGIGRDDEIKEPRSSPRLSRSNRQASLNLSDYLPPRHNSKVMSASSCEKEMRRRFLSQTKLRKSLSDLESEEVQGFKDLGFTFDKEDLNPDLVNILPGLQERNEDTAVAQENGVRRPYLSEAWLAQSYTPPVPIWKSKNSAEDMKAHIRFWARAVASNVGQES